MTGWYASIHEGSILRVSDVYFLLSGEMNVLAEKSRLSQRGVNNIQSRKSKIKLDQPLLH